VHTFPAGAILLVLPSNGATDELAERSSSAAASTDASGATFYAYPSIAVERDSDVLIGYSRFSASQYASANYSVPPILQCGEHACSPMRC